MDKAEKYKARILINIFLEKIPELNKTIVLQVHQTLSVSEKEGFDIVEINTVLIISISQSGHIFI